jgi:hypothetical protein
VQIEAAEDTYGILGLDEGVIDGHNLDVGVFNPYQ